MSVIPKPRSSQQIEALNEYLSRRLNRPPISLDATEPKSIQADHRDR
jgi:hypothetical protein